MNSTNLKTGVNKNLVHYGQNPTYNPYSVEEFLCWANAFKLHIHGTDCLPLLQYVCIHRSDWFFHKM